MGDRAQILHAIQRREVGECGIERPAITHHMCKRKTGQVFCRRDLRPCAVGCEFDAGLRDHGGGRIGQQNLKAALRHPHGVFAGAATEFQHTCAGGQDRQ
jgi:hypothetical protein